MTSRAAFLAHRLEDDIKLGKAAKPRPQQGKIETCRSNDMKDRRFLIEQGLDIQQLQLPARLVEDLPANGESLDPQRLAPALTIPVVGTGRPQHSQNRGRRVQPALPGTIVVGTEQDMAQLQAPIGLDHHGLPPFESQTVAAGTQKSPNVTHQAIANQVTRLPIHSLSLDGLLKGSGLEWPIPQWCSVFIKPEVSRLGKMQSQPRWPAAFAKWWPFSSLRIILEPSCSPMSRPLL